MADGVAPPGWPRAVPPPGVPGWDERAVAWLLDAGPPEYRGHAELRRHPLVLARLVRLHVAATVTGMRTGYATMRADLAGVVAPEVVTAALTVLEREGSRLAALEREVGLVTDALEGRRWSDRL